MFKRKRTRRKMNKCKSANLSAKPVISTLPEEKLSDIWYTQDEVLKYLGMSQSTCHRRRKDGSLIASKKFGKIYFNDYHVQKMLRDGLQKPLMLLVYLAPFFDGWEGLIAA